MALTKKTNENSAKNTLEGRFVDGNGNWYRGVVTLDGDGNHLIPTLTAPPTVMETLGDLTVEDSTAKEIVTTLSPTRHFRLEYDIDGTGIIFIGNSDVANDGTKHYARLFPGRVEHIDWNNVVGNMFLISTVASQKVSVGVQ